MASQCRGCGSVVTERYVRVFGDRDDTLHACPSCVPMSAIREGAGADREKAEAIHETLSEGKAGTTSPERRMLDPDVGVTERESPYDRPHPRAEKAKENMTPGSSDEESSSTQTDDDEKDNRKTFRCFVETPSKG